MRTKSASEPTLRRLLDHPLLSREQEAELAQRIKAGDETARHELVRHNLRLAWAFAARGEMGGTAKTKDLFGEAILALYQAARRFDAALGTFAQFSEFHLLEAWRKHARFEGYPLDVFGGERRMMEAMRAQTDYQRCATLAAYLTLSANVVNTSIARAAYAAQIRATEQLIDLEKEQLRLTATQVHAGTIPYANLLSIRSLIASNQALLAPLRQGVSQAEHLLATLEGVAPSRATLPDINLVALSLPSDLPVSLPSDLVRQRPDILAAEAQLHVASANIGIATAAMFPSFSLSGAYGAASSSLGNLSSSNARFWSIGPSATIPLFQGGSLWYGRKAAIDAYQQAQANYRQTVLGAFAQVANSLKALEHDAEGLQAQVDSQRAAGEALNLLQTNYRAGLVAYSDVLVADVQYQEAIITYLQAVAQRQQDTVALFVALGGGWWSRQHLTGEYGAP